MSRNASTDELYFVTLTVTNWIDVFTRRIYNDLIIENLTWCQQNKKLNIYAYVIMTNHIHLVANVTEGSLGDVLRDFKTFTSKNYSKRLRIIRRKAVANGCSDLLKKPEHIILITKTTSFGRMEIIR